MDLPTLQLSEEIKKALKVYKNDIKRPAKGALLYDYLIPSSVYKEQFDWDAFFMGVAIATDLPSEAIYLRNVALNFITNSDEIGYTPGCISPRGRDVRLNQMKPFLAQMVFLSSTFLNDLDWILPYYDSLKKIVTFRENKMWNKNYDLGVWFDSMESGVDNNVSVLNFPSNSVIATDCNTYIYREYQAFSLIAKQLGKTKDSLNFSKRASEIKNNINKHLWDEIDKSYYNIDSINRKFIKRMSFTNFVPLWAKIASEKRANFMIKKYLLNPQIMWSKYGVRTLSKNDPEYNNVNMIKPYSNWQGPIWPIANYLYTHILLNYGFQKDATEIACKTTKLVLNDIKESGGMHENYNADTGKSLAAPNFLSWNLLIGNLIDQAFQNKNPFELVNENFKINDLYSILDSRIIKKLSYSFANEIKKTKNKKPSSLSALSYTINYRKLKNNNKGVALVADGTIGKHAFWTYSKNKIKLTDKETFGLPASSTKDDYFRLLTQKVNSNSAISSIGLNLSYALEPKIRDGNLDGKLIRFAKEHLIKGLKGKLVGKELENYLSDKKHIIKPVSVANDIICILLAGINTNQSSPPQIAGLAAEGMNFAFIDSAKEWTTLNKKSFTNIAINLEAANYNMIPLTKAGKVINTISDYPDKALAEKESGSKYLFLLYNWIMKKVYGHTFQPISYTQQLNRIIKQKSHKGSDLANMLLERSSQIAVIELCGILIYLKKKGGVPVIMEGDLFWKGFKYKERVEKWIKIILPHVNVQFIHNQDSDLIGAATLTQFS